MCSSAEVQRRMLKQNSKRQNDTDFGHSRDAAVISV